jgi:hypothetical protein
MQQVQSHLAIDCHCWLKQHQMVLELLRQQNHLLFDQKYCCCHSTYVVLHFADQTVLYCQHCLAHTDC